MIARLLLWLSGHRCPTSDSIPFSRAVLCLDCDHVSRLRGECCDHCGSSGGALMPLWSAQLPLTPQMEAPRVGEPER